MPPPAGPQYDPDYNQRTADAFYQTYGAQTPHQMLAARESGQPAGAVPPNTRQPSASPQPAGSGQMRSSMPQDAGSIESASPGYFNNQNANMDMQPQEQGAYAMGQPQQPPAFNPYPPPGGGGPPPGPGAPMPQIAPQPSTLAAIAQRNMAGPPEYPRAQQGYSPPPTGFGSGTMPGATTQPAPMPANVPAWMQVMDPAQIAARNAATGPQVLQPDISGTPEEWRQNLQYSQNAMDFMGNQGIDYANDGAPIGGLGPDFDKFVGKRMPGLPGGAPGVPGMGQPQPGPDQIVQALAALQGQQAPVNPYAQGGVQDVLPQTGPRNVLTPDQAAADRLGAAQQSPEFSQGLLPNEGLGSRDVLDQQGPRQPTGFRGDDPRTKGGARTPEEELAWNMANAGIDPNAAPGTQPPLDGGATTQYGTATSPAGDVPSTDLGAGATPTDQPSTGAAATDYSHLNDQSMTWGTGGGLTYTSGDLSGGGSPGQFNETGYINSNGAFKSWENVTWKTHQEADPIAFVHFGGDNWWSEPGFWNHAIKGNTKGVTKLAGNITSPEQFVAQNGTANYTTDSQGKAAIPSDVMAGLPNPLQSMIQKLEDYSGRLASMDSANNSDLKQATRLRNDIETLQAALAEYGITITDASGNHPYDSLQAGQGGGGGGGGTQPPGGDYPGGTLPDDPGTVVPLPGDSQHEGPYQPYEVPQAPNNYGQLMTDEIIKMFGLTEGKHPEQWAAAFELISNLDQNRRTEIGRQQGINELLRNQFNISADQDPLRAGAEQQALDIIQNPNSVDFQGIRNRAIADNFEDTEAATQMIGNVAGGRGLGLGTMTGQQAELERQSGLDLSRRLGELSTMEDLQNRQDQLKAIDVASGVSGQYAGADSLASQMIAQAMAGQPWQIQNPLQGTTGLSSDVAMMQLYRDLIADAKHGGGWTTDDWANLGIQGLGGLAGGAINSG